MSLIKMWKEALQWTIDPAVDRGADYANLNQAAVSEWGSAVLQFAMQLLLTNWTETIS